MGSLLQIRNVPDDELRVLKARAAEQGESLNTYLLKLIAREVARPTAAQVLERAARRLERGPGPTLEVLGEARRERDENLDQRRG
ncbi:hypothetical protein [Arthrobacter sp. JSM 101049]|uniref:FitA-like ribbon-helix-helix domain-containing protein n=1 Tax=Arthrobacter sp. JSM 101049 TaxID=929097 RepID=UPI00356A5162